MNRATGVDCAVFTQTVPENSSIMFRFFFFWFNLVEDANACTVQAIYCIGYNGLYVELYILQMGKQFST